MNAGGIVLVLCNNGTKGNGHSLKYRKFHTNIRKYLFTMKMLEQWNFRLPREVVESSVMEILKTCLDGFMCNLLWETCFSRSIELDDIKRSLPNPEI